MSVVAGSHRSSWVETAIIVVQALAIAMFVRVFLYQPFNIPSGSMKETLLVGDYLFVSKLSYGYSRYSFPSGREPVFSGRIFAAEPKRGDVAVFKLPRDNATDYIKRVIGLPGDEIQMRDGVLYINGKAVPKVAGRRLRQREESRPRAATPRLRGDAAQRRQVHRARRRAATAPSTTPALYKVPAGHYFMMGDNRDNSTDSRVQRSRGVGYVPLREPRRPRRDHLLLRRVDEPDALRWTRPGPGPSISAGAASSISCGESRERSNAATAQIQGSREAARLQVQGRGAAGAGADACQRARRQDRRAATTSGWSSSATACWASPSPKC